MTRTGIPRPYLGDVSRSSGILSSSQSVCDHECILVAIIVLTDGVNDGTVTVYDNPSAASGTVLGKVVACGDEKIGGEVHIACQADKGLYVEITGTGATALVRYIP